jgi:hypothetical protein
MKKNVLKNERGQVIIVGLVFFAILLLFSGALTTYVSSYVKSGRTSVVKAQALGLAEAGIDKAAYELNQDSGYTGEDDTALGNGVFSVSVSSISGNAKRVVSTACVPNCANPRATRTVRATLTINNEVISFNYGVQAGNGGFVMNGGALIEGNVYSNGSIVATNGVHITGSATAANPPTVYADQANATPLPPPSPVTFANSTSTQDFAQSFQLSVGEPMNNIQFYIKKVGSPSNIAVKIVNDSAGSPGSTVFMSGTLSAALVTSSFGWVTATMPSTPVLDPGQTYWMVLDTSSNASKYYILGANNNGYANGVAKIGKYGTSWSDTSPAGLDGYFQMYLGGDASTLGGSDYDTGVYVGTTGSDNAWAHNVKGATVSGNLYCQVGSHNNKACDTSRPDPTPQPMPLSDANIQDWKDEAEAGGTLPGDYHVGWAGATLGPNVIDGDLLIDGGGTLTVAGTLYIKGNITLTGGGIVRLAASYGSSNGVIVTDGYVILEGGSNFYGSGEDGSYPFLITTSACPVAPGCDGYNAISLSGGAGTVALIAQEGNVLLNGGSALKAVTGKQITMSGGAVLEYDSGLVNANFTSGPGGSWQFQPGSYVIEK